MGAHRCYTVGLLSWSARSNFMRLIGPRFCQRIGPAQFPGVVGRRRAVLGGEGRGLCGPPVCYSRNKWQQRGRYEGRERSRDEGATSLKATWEGDAVYGVEPVLAALEAGRRTIKKLCIQENMQLKKRRDSGAVSRAVKIAGETGIAIQYASKHDLNMVVDNRPHQGLIIDCSPLEWIPLGDFPEVSLQSSDLPPVWLALDEVVDPQNLGAVIRSAYFLGAAGIVVSSKNSAPLSPAVSKASAGALESLPIHSCTNMPRMLLDAREKGWHVIGAAPGEGSVYLTDIAVSQPSILVMGNEGYGVRTNVKRACQSLVRIEDGMEPGERRLDSLNVSVATGILLHHLVFTARKQPKPDAQQ
eukprot:evm.model.scf_537.4 EVM.evm.TU.scf_537.4   scf_537:57642-63830(+)